MTVYGVFEPADHVMGDPRSQDELYSLWWTEYEAKAEAERLSKSHGYTFVVKPMEVQGARKAEAR